VATENRVSFPVISRVSPDDFANIVEQQCTLKSR
jgi:hypothetical protein